MMATFTKRISVKTRPKLPRASPPSIRITPGGRWSIPRNSAGVLRRTVKSRTEGDREPAWHYDFGRRYFVTIRLAEGVASPGAAGEMANVSQAFQPSGRFCAANSL